MWKNWGKSGVKLGKNWGKVVKSGEKRRKATKSGEKRGKAGNSGGEKQGIVAAKSGGGEKRQRRKAAAAAAKSGGGEKRRRRKAAAAKSGGGEKRRRRKAAAAKSGGGEKRQRRKASRNFVSQNGRQRPFCMTGKITFDRISPHFRSIRNFFAKWPPAAILDSDILPKSIGTSLYSMSVATSNMKLIGAFLIKL